MYRSSFIKSRKTEKFHKVFIKLFRAIKLVVNYEI